MIEVLIDKGYGKKILKRKLCKTEMLFCKNYDNFTKL